VAKLQLSSTRTPCFFQVHYSVVRLLGAGTVDPGFHKRLFMSSPCYPQYCSTSRAELVIVPTLNPPNGP
jgi:hypothetical protein